MLGGFCDLYNAAIQQRIEAWRRSSVTLKYLDQASEIKAVRASDERLAAASFSACQQVLRRVDRAFKAFYRRLGQRGKAGFPRFRSHGGFSSAEFRVGDGLTIKKTGKIGIVGLAGELKVKWHRAIPNRAKTPSAVITRSAGNKWFVCFQVRMPDEPKVRHCGPSIGVDVGLMSLIATSAGETVKAPKWEKHARAKRKTLQRRVARCKKGSKRREKARVRLARHHAKVAAKRRDFLHKVSRRLVDDYGLVALEDLDIHKMAKSTFAGSIYDASWGMLRQFILYKAESAGTKVVLVDPRGTSRECPNCGDVKPKPLSQRHHVCPCGCRLDRDVAAARVILKRATTDYGPGAGPRPTS